jgi:formylglycine-generating enzyme required for sulfatase activity
VEADFPVEKRVRVTCASVSAYLTGGNAVPETKPAATGEVVAIHGQIFADSDIIASVESTFVLVAPGTFLMGSPDYEAGRGGDETVHEVTLTKPFYMQKTPVMQGLWMAVMGSNTAFFRDGGNDLPMEGISWDECQQFLRKLNSIKDGNYRLPTEAEWEYACRAGSTTPFENGKISELYCGRDPILWETGWYCGNSGKASRPVARKSPNAWGLYDMHGNVCEWCQDWYGDYSTGSRTDPRGPESGPGKVVRGGSWFSNSKNCRSAARFHWPSNYQSDFIGFRLLKET